MPEGRTLQITLHFTLLSIEQIFSLNETPLKAENALSAFDIILEYI
jgi:hypothetical protein